MEVTLAHISEAKVNHMARPSIEVGRKKPCFLMPRREGGPVIGEQAATQSVRTRECTVFVLIISLLLKGLT